MNRDSRRLRLVLALLLLTSLTLLTLDVRAGKGGAFGAVRNALGTLLGPVGRAVGTITAPVGDAGSAALHARRDADRITALERDNEALKRQIADDAQAKADVAELRRLQYLEFRGHYTFVPAAVAGVGAAFGNAEQTVTINRGTVDGVAVGMAVTTGDGLVGRTVRVDRYTSLVALITDPTTTVFVTVESQRGNTYARVTGQGPGRPLQLVFGDPTTTLKVGDRLVTLGSETYKQGIPVGTITAIDNEIGGISQSATVAPFVDTGALGVLSVVVGSTARGPVNALPPRASPAPETPAPAPVVPPAVVPPVAPGATPAPASARPTPTP